MKSLADQLKGLGYVDKHEDNKKPQIQSKKIQQPKSAKEQIKDRQKKQQINKERDARKRRLNAQPKDDIFKLAINTDKYAIYTIVAYIDDIGEDKNDSKVTVVSINCLHMYIDGELYIVDHTHLRSDRITIQGKWQLGQKITFKAMLKRYPGRVDKYELVDEL